MSDFIKIRGTVYREAAMDEISMLDLMRFDAELASDGLPYRWADVQRIGEELAGLSDEEANRHPDAPFMMAATIWLTMRAADEPISLLEAAAIKGKDIDFVASPSDRQAKQAGPTRPAAKKTAKKAPARPASAAAK